MRLHEGRTNDHTPSSGSEESTWQRETQVPAASGQKVASGAGWGVMDHDGVPPALERSRVLPVEANIGVALARVESTPCPASPLWVFFVTSKNSPVALISCHSASIPRSRSSGTI